ncbi:MAG: histidine triad nucleotide-binding protein [Thermodesulfobacteriota bacterium]
MSDCIFCKIASREMPSTIVDESEKLITIKDINPQAPTHLLIIPKEHFPTILECTDKTLLGDMLTTANRLAEEQGFAQKGFRTVINTNEEGGQIVRHLHMHLLAGRPLSGKMG